MILVFGGTTEGRQAIKTLEEAGSTYYYSTRSDGQEVQLVHGERLTGTMDEEAIVACCQAHGIRLLVDAAHPFAVVLHRNLLRAACRLQVPVVRYERIYPPRSSDLFWCEDYQDAIRQMEEQGIDRLLALTGVNNIGTLRPFWQQHECWFRILSRSLSQQMAQQAQFPEDHLVYYEEDDTDALLSRLSPQAILTKESGLSGGFQEKVEAARSRGISVFVIKRSQLSFAAFGLQPAAPLLTVDGPHGLRRAVEKFLPDFYPLKSGLTTGTCATAAALAAMLLLTRGEHPAEVPVILPDGETIHVPVSYGEGYAAVVKEAGDDPDVTNGLEIRAAVKFLPDGHAGAEPPADHPTVTILGGEGVGTFTLPGFDYPPGSPAINKGPRQMIVRNLQPLISDGSVEVTITVPQGAEIARRTFNPRLGIEGGISIIGVSGIVKPFSEEAFIDSIRKCMQVAKASGTSHVVINSGAKSERFLRDRYPQLPQQAFVQYGNYVGETLKMARDLQIPHVTLGVMLGKAVKLAEGQLDTHSRRATMNRDFICQLLQETGCTVDISGITLARELWTLIPADKLSAFASTVIRHCASHCQPLLPDAELTVLLIGEEGTIFTY